MLRSRTVGAFGEASWAPRARWSTTRPSRRPHSATAWISARSRSSMRASRMAAPAITMSAQRVEPGDYAPLLQAERAQHLGDLAHLGAAQRVHALRRVVAKRPNDHAREVA